MKPWLLCWYGTSGTYQWACASEVYRGCPAFACSTLVPVQIKSAIYKELCDFLGLSNWSNEQMLESELRLTFNKIHSSRTNWQKHLYSVLQWVAQNHKSVATSNRRVD